MTAITPSIAATWATRTAVLWAILRIGLAAFLGALPDPLPDAPSGDGPGLRATTSVAVIGVVMLLVLIDMRAMRERAFLANLGVSVPAIAGVSFAVATLLEALLVTILLST